MMARLSCALRPVFPLFVLAAFLSVPPAIGQTTTATLRGTIKDTSHAVLPGAAVTLREVNTGFVRTTVSDRSGGYVLSFVPAGTYELRVELAGFKTLQREGLRFEIGQEPTIDAALELASVAETITVREEAPLVATTKSAVDQVISREEIDSLPLAGRQASSLALLAPGVVQRGTDTAEPVTTGGQPRGSGEMLVDGVSNELMAVNAIRSNTPPDAVQEFQVITSQYQAEFGNASGVILNTITRSGTNDLHGRAYYFHRDEGLDARNAFATTKASFEQKQGGGWLGGPVVRDRTHYFATYEATRRMQIASVTSPVAPGDVEQPLDNDQFLAKLTHQLTSNHRLTGRFNVDRPIRKNVGVGGFTLAETGFEQRTEDFVYAGSLTSIFSNRALNELRVQVSDQLIALVPNTPNVLTIMRPSSTSGKPSNVPQEFAELRFQVVDNFTYERGSHRFKFGIDINRLALEGFVHQFMPGTFTFATDRPFDPNDLTTYPTSFAGNSGNTDFDMPTTGVALFAQDSWRLPRNVTLNVGVRYDAWDVTGADLQKGNVAPRLAAAWDPTGSGRTAIRGGYGLFYNNVLTNAPLFAHFLSGLTAVLIVNPGYPDPFSRGSELRQPLSTYVAQRDQPLPHAHQTTAGVQRDLGRGIVVSADYVSSKGRELIRMIDTNPVTPPAFTRPDPTRGFVRMLESTGYSNYHALLVNGKTTLRARGILNVAYTLSSYKTTTEAENNPIQQDDLTKDDAYGYGNFDQRHRLVVGGYYTLPGDVQVGAVLTGRSGVPFNITTGRDNNRNGLNTDRPDLVSGGVGTADMENRASFADPGTRPGNLPRNAGRGPAFWQLDARLAKRFQLGAARVEGLVEAFNVTNRVNFNNIVGNLASAAFGRPNTAFDARQVQLGLRVEF